MSTEQPARSFPYAKHAPALLLMRCLYAPPIHSKRPYWPRAAAISATPAVSEKGADGTPARPTHGENPLIVVHASFIVAPLVVACAAAAACRRALRRVVDLPAALALRLP